MWPIYIEWVYKTLREIQLSEDLDGIQERTLSMAFDAESCTHSTLTEKLQMLNKKNISH